MSKTIHELTMPKWGATMEGGVLVKWLLEVGDQIVIGTAVAEVETDKIVSVLEAPHDGVLKRKVVEEGEKLSVGALLGVMADASVTDEQIDAFLASAPSASASVRAQRRAG